jgi:BirA family biotin operon repressor/biotin-[acetyl-CoA-carboxylase] ligase
MEKYRMNFKVEWHERLGSTNACLKERFLQGFEIPSGFIIAAREQTAGRGRSDRRWLSAPDTNLCFSLYICTAAELRAVPSLTMAAALAVTGFLNARGIAAAPKWPNDVLVGNKKICGILSERVEHKGNTGIIVGIGLNVNMTSEEAAAIDRPATSMLIEGGKAHEPANVLEALFPLLDHWIGAWEQGGFPAIRTIWTEKAGPIGKPLSVHDGNTKKSGTLAGFGDHGELLLQTAIGPETIWSGDVT